ncbi:hypothetical protein A2U01_0083189 [Trifolium medium]|uniref:Uncharacterized protein n=1 Tax=Trifolium medium TaxID=97028 RepID=A0A392TLT5_9FABA|nr:hypothetical protein [Trifolium medium]
MENLRKRVRGNMVTSATASARREKVAKRSPKPKRQRKVRLSLSLS